jgi:hypothetical protein
MTVRRCRDLLTIALLVVLCTGLPTGAVAHGPDPVLGGSPFGQDQALEFGWRSGSVPVASIAAAIRAAAADLSATRGSRAATFAYVSGGSNLIGYGTGATCGVNGIACFTRTAPTSFTMWLREQGHVFDWGTLKWCQTYTTAPNGCYDAETIALDEFGHVEILDHHVNLDDSSDYTDAVVQTFSRTKPSAGWNMHSLGPCDVATLQRQYDMVSWAAKYADCGTLATTLTVAAPAAVAYGGKATITATLKVTDLSAYARLGANPVSGRVVTLQVRGPGTTTWLTSGTMAAGTTSGTYTKTLSLTSDIQVRAVFRTPAGEGLTGDTSPVVTIAVGPCRTLCPSATGKRP